MSEKLPEYKIWCAERYLEHVRALNCRIGTLQDKIQHHRENMALSGQSYAEGVSGSKEPDSMYNAVVRLQEMVADFCTEMAEYVEEQERAHSCMKKMAHPEYAPAHWRSRRGERFGGSNEIGQAVLRSCDS